MKLFRFLPAIKALPAPKRRLLLCAALAVLLLAVAAFAEFLCPYDPAAQIFPTLEGPSLAHPAGTDRYGRDLFSRLLMGLQTSVFSALALVGIVVILGTALGMLCGYRGGRLDGIIMRLADLCLAFPGLVLALAAAALLGGGVRNGVLALALVNWPKYARIARSQTLALKNTDYVAAARLAGDNARELLLRHILPNALGPILVTATLDIGAMVMELAALSFLGLGAQPPTAELGSMMSENRSMMQTYPWVVMGPGIAIFLAVAVFNLLGEAVRDALDPGKKEEPVRQKKKSGKKKKALALLLGTCCLLGIFLPPLGEKKGNSPAAQDAKTTFVLGDTTFNSENEEPDVNPHNAYSGWACIRYGIGETLFRYSETMELEPWLAAGWEQIDTLTWQITLREGISFSSGRPLIGESVKECLEHLVQVHPRAAGDLMLDTITAQGQTVTIRTTSPNPTLLHGLSDPYSCIIDMEEGVKEGMVTGTGPYVPVSLISGQELHLIRNEQYWNGQPGFEKITVLTITDGDTLTMALQSGEIDGAYGLPYVSYSLFEQGDYTFSSCATSRAFLLHMNFESPVTSHKAVRQAIAMGIDKDRFVQDLLGGHGYPADGAFPQGFAFSGKVTAKEYDPEGAKKLLAENGWIDQNGDGIREKGGQPLTLRWLTYSSRQELPLLAESAQASLKELGIQVEIISTADHNTRRQDPTAWDVYASAMVTAPTGDPAYFFATHCLDSSVANNGHYHNDALEELAAQLSRTFDDDQRSQLSQQMQQILLDDDAFVFCSHLQMSLVCRKGITGLTAHPCDFYEITAALAPTGETK